MRLLWLLAVVITAPCTWAQRMNPSDRMRFATYPEESRILGVDGQNLRWTSEVEDDDLVTDLPGLDNQTDVKHHAGHIAVGDNAHNKLFYWHFVAAKEPENAPLVIWLNGGPGCSSMQGLFLGVSPFKLTNASSIDMNEHSWHHVANLLFVDQPLGTGLSVSKGIEYRDDESAISSDFYDFLSQFFAKHQEYLVEGEDYPSTRDFYIFGESHAGRYIPRFTKYILEQNENIANVDDSRFQVHMNLAGIGIGNGWVHPRIQYDYSDFAHALGLIKLGQVKSLKAKYQECEAALEAGTYYASSCFDNLDAIMASAKNPQTNKRLNYYDVRGYVSSVREYPPGQDDIVAYLNRKDVRRALHAFEEANYKYRICSDQVYKHLKQLDGASSLLDVEYALQHNVRTLFYNGQWDLMCNHYGTEELLLHLNWTGADAFQDADKYTWLVDGRDSPAGFVQEGGNLSYVVVADSGHMVMLTVPAVTKDLVDRFIHGRAYNDSPQAVGSLSANASEWGGAQCFDVEEYLMSSHALATSWLWVSIVIAIACSVLVACVTAMCVRGRHAKSGEHEVIIHGSDEETAATGMSDSSDEEEVSEEEEEGDAALGQRTAL